MWYWYYLMWQWNHQMREKKLKYPQMLEKYGTVKCDVSTA